MQRVREGEVWRSHYNRLLLLGPTTMEASESRDCHFLCFRNCRDSNEEDLAKLNKFASFEKLSLKKIKEEQLQINRTQSYKRIDRPIPTTERSAEEGENHLLQLIEMKKKVELELNTLNHDFDKYYEIYAKKLKELRDIQARMCEPPRERRKM